VYYIDYNEQCNNLTAKQPLVSLLPGNNSLVPEEQPPSTTMGTLLAKNSPSPGQRLPAKEAALHGKNLHERPNANWSV
jgi:hypothetical protein